MESIARKLIYVGIAGLVLACLLNALALLMLGQPAALPFSKYWWVSWLPFYLIWLVFLVAGLRGRRRNSPADHE